MNDNKAWENIKALREYYGETQDELAEIIGVSRQAIQMWEYGTIEIKSENITKLAYHYRVSETDLLYGDFSKYEKGKGAIKYTTETVAEVIKTMFPIFKPKEETLDADFEAGYLVHKEFRDSFIMHSTNQLSGLKTNQDEELFDQTFDKAIEAIDKYVDSFDRNNEPYSAANLLSLFCMFAYIIAEADMAEQYESINDFSSFENNKKAMKKLYLRKNVDRKGKPVEGLDIDDEDKAGFFELYDELLKPLRNEKWNNVYEYFIAYKYLFNICDNGKDKDINQSFGSELLILYAELGNTFVLKRMKAFRKIYN